MKKILCDIKRCRNCYSDLFDILDALSEDYPDKGIIMLWQLLKKEGVNFKDERNKIINIKCPNCGNSLSLGDYLIIDIDIFEEEFVELISSKLNEKIEECEYCNTSIIPYQYDHGDPLNLNQVYELLDSYGIREELGNVYDEIISKLRCSCGNSLNLDDPYITKREIKNWFGEEVFEDIANVIIDTFEIRKDLAYDFVDHLMKYPMLGLEHETGGKIYKKIKKKEIPKITTLSNGKILYRARKRNKINRHVPFVSSEMWAPPLGRPGHGRFNPTGVQALYLANSPKTCIEEIELKKEIKEVAEIAEFFILKDLIIWDVRDLDIEYFVNRMPSMNNNVVLKEYMFPNFLAQSCALAGINGIKYKSVKDDNWNIVLLNYEKNKTILLNDIYDDITNQNADVIDTDVR